MSSFDMDKLMQQAAQMQEQVARMQQEAEQETAQSSVGGGLVKVTANGAGDVVAIEISPHAIDPDDPEPLADLVLAGWNEARLWAIIVLALIDVVIWGWAFDFSPR